MAKLRATFSKFTLDALLSTTLLYIVLMSYVGLAYAIIVIVLFALGLLTQTAPDIAFSPPSWVILLSLLLIVPTLLPVHRWLRMHIDLMIYGQHDDPYALISEINAQLQVISSPQMTLPLVAATVARALKLPYVAMTTNISIPPFHCEVGEQGPPNALTMMPLLYLDKPLGTLTVSWRRANEALSELDHELLKDVARQVGIALHVVQLAADLQASRERLVISREEERRRIRNDLHDGLGPTLSALQLQLGAMRNLIRQQPDQAEKVVNELRDDLRQATAEIRQLVYDLRPPLLDELGLVEAIKGLRVAGSALELEVIAPDPMPKLSAALEVAIYRIASEALHNVVRHSQATHCTVSLARESVEAGHAMLTLVVRDNGKSLPAAPVAGVGFASMKERAAELGGALSILPGALGGVEVVAHFPLGTA